MLTCSPPFRIRKMIAHRKALDLPFRPAASACSLRGSAGWLAAHSRPSFTNQPPISNRTQVILYLYYIRDAPVKRNPRKSRAPSIGMGAQVPRGWLAPRPERSRRTSQIARPTSFQGGSRATFPAISLDSREAIVVCLQLRPPKPYAFGDRILAPSAGIDY